MIVGADGQPMVTENMDGRYIKIVESKQGDKMVWGVEFGPGEAHFDPLEALQVLGDVVRGLAQNTRSLLAEKRAMQEVRRKMAEMAGENK